jgi:hypothetical protein
MRLIEYYPKPEGVDRYWTTSLELYCYLYYNQSERDRMQTLANLMGDYDGHLFRLYHPCDKHHLRIKKGQSDLDFLKHLRVLFDSIEVDILNPTLELECTSTAVVNKSSKLK